MRKPSIAIVIFFLLLSSISFAEETIEKYQWDLSELYPSVEAWEKALTELDSKIQTLPSLKGSLGKSPKSLEKGLSEISDTYKGIARAYSYASMSRDEDQRDAQAQARFGKIRQMFAKFSESISWYTPEVLEIGEKKIHKYLKKNPALERFRFPLEEILREAPHTLDAKTEALLAQAGLVLSSASQIYENYANADIPWPTITLASGEAAELNQAGYSFWRAHANREVRKQVFDSFWGTWNQYADGMGATLATEVQSNIFSARARNYESVLQQNLFNDGLPENIYTQLVTQVNDALPIFHRYLKLRGKILGINELRYYDIYPPLVQANTGKFNLSRSKDITFEALKPFGKQYLDLLEHGLSQDWMHSHPQKGKTSGAYMNSSAYDVHPYVLLNHNDDYESLSTFAHEWGHAVHSLLANEAQPWETAGYSTFIAEMASTINEILLQEYMIANAKTKEEKLFYLGQALESFRGTLFRQAMFAEFELAIHQHAEKGEPLTGPTLTHIYGDLLKRYHGHDKGVMKIDDLYAVEWAYIPHFYGDFYVFQYATSISGAAWFAEQFLAGDEAVRDAFIRVLRAGGSDYPHNILLKEAGLDMTKAESYQPVMRRMTSLMDRIETLIKED